MKDSRRILIYDIETSLMKKYSYRLYGDYNTPDDIIKDWSILCVSWKWLGERGVYSESGNEKRMLDIFGRELDKSDIIVHHNGSKFDYKRLQTRALALGLKPFHPINAYNSVDTYLVAKRYMDLSSNSLHYLAKILGVGDKLKVSKQLWYDVDRGVEGAIEKMVRYNRRDVRVLERVYKKIRPWAVNHPVIIDPDRRCKSCSSNRLQSRGLITLLAGKYRRLRCADCGHQMRDPKIISRNILR